MRVGFHGIKDFNSFGYDVVQACDTFFQTGSIIDIDVQGLPALTVLVNQGFNMSWNSHGTKFTTNAGFDQVSMTFCFDIVTLRQITVQYQQGDFYESNERKAWYFSL